MSAKCPCLNSHMLLINSFKKKMLFHGKVDSLVPNSIELLFPETATLLWYTTGDL